MRRIACSPWHCFLPRGLLRRALSELPKAVGAADQPKPEELLRKVADYLAGLPALSCRIDSSIHIQAQGIDNRMDCKMTLRLERPNRLAILSKRG